MAKQLLLRLAIAVSLVSAPALAQPVAADDAFYEALQDMMAELRPLSRHDAQRIKDAYGRVSTFADRDHLEEAIEADRVALLPDDPLAFNVDPRLEGRHPIGEKDLANQATYVGARPATLGLLYAIASRVESNPVEVTSLVRHLRYQRALSRSNGNARTDVPTHAMGFAFDIALVNTPLETVYEIRDVLRDLRSAGRLYFIGESRQLVFHVVPTRSSLGYYDALHLLKTSAPAPALPAVPPVGTLMQRAIPAPRMIAISFAEQTLPFAWVAAMLLLGGFGVWQRRRLLAVLQPLTVQPFFTRSARTRSR